MFCLCGCGVPWVHVSSSINCSYCYGWSFGWSQLVSIQLKGSWWFGGDFHFLLKGWQWWWWGVYWQVLNFWLLCAWRQPPMQACQLPQYFLCHFLWVHNVGTISITLCCDGIEFFQFIESIINVILPLIPGAFCNQNLFPFMICILHKTCHYGMGYTHLHHVCHSDWVPSICHKGLTSCLLFCIHC